MWLLMWALVGCEPAMVDVPLDQDQDGLLSDIEEEIGTDPQNDDSDDDGHLDGDEVLAGTDPLDADEHPYKGGWSVGDCRDDIQSTGGHAVGDIAPDFELMDQNGEMVRFYDFCDDVVLLVSSAFW